MAKGGAARGAVTRGPLSPPVTSSSGTGWWFPAVAGATAFWFTNLVISLTPEAATYRSALSIAYVPMLIEAAVGGLVIAGGVALLLPRLPERVPGGPIGKALLLALGALVLLTMLVEVPAKLRSDVADTGHWLLLATVFNTIRILALGVAIGLATRAQEARRDGRPGVMSQEVKP
jgi:hypothetical protein